MKHRLFLDLDGVLADFDRAAREQFGFITTKDGPDPPGLWDKVRAHGTFYRDLTVMPDAHVLWRGVRELRPTILTGVPRSVPGVALQKKAWVAEHFGDSVTVLCCASRQKCMFASRGDILIDDREKHRSLWEEVGGIWITHVSAVQSLRKLDEALARRGVTDRRVRWEDDRRQVYGSVGVDGDTPEHKAHWRDQ